MPDTIDEIESDPDKRRLLIQTEKLAGVGRLAAQLAHQLNTPLGAILLSARAIEEVVAGTEVEEDLRIILDATRRCQRIVGRMQNYSRAPGVVENRINFCHLVHRIDKILDRSVASAEVTLRVGIAPGRYLVQGDATELEHAIFALLENALDASPRGGFIDIRMELAYDEGVLRMVVGDQGPGLPEEIKDRVFEPFVTTKPPGKGTGLGLSISRSILEAHGGTLDALPPSDGAGAVFSVVLPLAPDLLRAYQEDPARVQVRAIPFGTLRARARGELETGCEVRGLVGK